MKPGAFTTLWRNFPPLFIVLAIVLAFTDRCAAQQATEYDIKAVYLYNFLLFITWPPAEAEKLVIGIVGDDPFGKAFREVEDTAVKGTAKRLKTKRFGRYREGEALGGCNILFISGSEKENFEKITAAVKNRPVLTAADSPGFLARGGMINLVVINDKVRWEINRTRIEEAGLKLTSQLLQSAVRVER
jgi:hypothetical protein